jgi:ubiquitin carboxyl-terminal hydrolase 4/11/15
MELQEFMKEAKKGTRFEIFWRKDESGEKSLEEKISYLEDGRFRYISSYEKKSETTLQDCFRLFETPETLTEENPWYCPKCKALVQARKEMKIYKAPKILILCLKRFKRDSYWAEKLET